MLRSDESLHHDGQAFPWAAVGHVLEHPAVAVVQVTPRLDQRHAVGGHIGEVPVKAALGDMQPLTPGLDPECVWTAVNKYSEPGLYPIVRRSRPEPCGGGVLGSIR